MENVEAIAVIIGLVNGVQLATLPDRRGFLYFCVAVAAGLLFGFTGLFGLNVESGIIASLASSGVYKVAQKIGNSAGNR